MTGEEYWNLKKGDTVKVIAPFYKHNAGDLLRVEYIDNMHGKVYLRNFNEPLGKQVEEVKLCDVLNNIGLSDEPIDKDRNHIFLPYAIGDEVWFITDNEVKKGKVTSYGISYNVFQGATIILYQIECSDTKKTVVVKSHKCFRTKEELVKSL